MWSASTRRATKDAKYQASFAVKCMRKSGGVHVYFVLWFDGACKPAFSHIENEVPHVSCVVDAAHSIDLMGKNICSTKPTVTIKGVGSKPWGVTKFGNVRAAIWYAIKAVYAQEKTLSMYRAITKSAPGTVRFDRPAASREPPLAARRARTPPTEIIKINIFITAVPAQYYAGTTQGSGPGVLRSAAYYAPSLAPRRARRPTCPCGPPSCSGTVLWPSNQAHPRKRPSEPARRSPSFALALVSGGTKGKKGSGHRVEIKIYLSHELIQKILVEGSATMA